MHFSRIEVVTYNAHCLLLDVRLEMLLNELHDIQWDVIVITETWREEISEYFVLPCGHHFYGSGGKRGSCGVGFLVHKRWSCHNFTPFSERLAYLDLHLQSFKLRCFGVYMPQAACPDCDVDEIYTTMETSFQNNKRTLICGDFNAHVGKSDGEAHWAGILGCNAAFTRNARGAMLLHFCLAHDFMIANTMFQSGLNSSWTFRGFQTYTQVDYIMTDRKLSGDLVHCGIEERLDIGSEHRAVRATFKFSLNAAPRHSKRSAATRSYDVIKYKQSLDSRLASSSESSINNLEDTILASARHAQANSRRACTTQDDLVDIRRLIRQRRLRKDKGSFQYKDLCKQIQMLTRRRSQSLKALKIKSILENFKGLKYIPQIKVGGKRVGISRLVGADGSCVTDK